MLHSELFLIDARTTRVCPISPYYLFDLDFLLVATLEVNAIGTNVGMIVVQLVHPITNATHAENLSHLGVTQLRRFERLGELSDINNSISNLRQAAQLTNNSHPNKSLYLSNLGVSQRHRFRR